jgi:hypothetical protein
MLLILSPAKTLDFDSPLPAATPPSTRPGFAGDAARLVRRLRELDAGEIGRLMDISADLARLNADRFRSFRTRAPVPVERPALHAFRGDVYLGLRAEQLDAAQLAFAQQHLRILSGLYGVLRPLDAIQPYRLEMGTALDTGPTQGLYAWWGSRIARALRRDARSIGTGTLVNLASQEYFRAVDTRALGLRVITPVFKERRNGQLKIISFSAKRARGAMAGFAIRNRLVEPEPLRGFAEDGYRFAPALSGPDEWVFAR